MNFQNIARMRYSCRNYLPEDVDTDKLLIVLDAFRIAPSAANYQPWHLIVISSPEKKEIIYNAYQRDWIKTAPVLIVACGDHSASWKRKDGKDHLDIDIAIAVDHLTLQATELGLATCWVCNFDRSILEQGLKLPKNFEPVVIIPLGYPKVFADPERHSSTRKSINEIVHWEKL
jgi:nitroreductase